MLVLPTQHNTLQHSHSAMGSSSCLADLAKTVVQPAEPIIQTLLVKGNLDTLLKFYQMWKEPHNVSQQFVYSWVTTMSAQKNGHRNSLCADDTFCMQVADDWLNPKIDEETKRKAVSEASVDLWPKIASFIPLNRLKCLQRLAQVWDELSEHQITYADVVEWKLSEPAILLFEFLSQQQQSSNHMSLPMLQRMESFFPELEFILRSVSTSAKNSVDRNGTKVKMVTESFSIFAQGEESHMENHFQVLETKSKTTVFRLHQFDPTAKQPTVASLQLLSQYQNLFRDPSKMAIYRGNTAPQMYHWYSLFNDSSLDVFYEYAQMPSATIQSA